MYQLLHKITVNRVMRTDWSTRYLYQRTAILYPNTRYQKIRGNTALLSTASSSLTVPAKEYYSVFHKHCDKKAGRLHGLTIQNGGPFIRVINGVNGVR